MKSDEKLKQKIAGRMLDWYLNIGVIFETKSHS